MSRYLSILSDELNERNEESPDSPPLNSLNSFNSLAQQSETMPEEVLRQEFLRLWTPEHFVPLTPALMARILGRDVQEVSTEFHHATQEDLLRLIHYAKTGQVKP